MRKKNVVAVILTVALVSVLTGCAMFNKGTLQYSRTTTMGKELIDLQEAKAKGALTEEEYAKAKKAILEGGPMKVENACSGAK